MQSNKAFGRLGKQAKGSNWKCVQPVRKCKSISFVLCKRELSKMLLEAASFLAWG